MTLDDFKSMAPSMIREMDRRKDVFDSDNGIAIIYSENLNKYLEEYMCKDREELLDTLYYGHGIFCKIVD